MKAIKAKFFPYGVHVPDHKDLTCDCPIEEMPAPKTIAIALSQFIGKPASPIVNVGDQVKQGSLIASQDGFISANVFSSVSGQVTSIEEKMNSRGVKEKFIFIENDELYQKDYLEPLTNPTPQDIVKRVQDAGIVGLGGAAFPTYVKLSPKNAVDVLIINGAECEPYLNCDYRIMLEKTDEIAQGIRLIAKSLNVSKIIVAIEANKPKAIEIFERFEDFEVVILKKQYPMGSEKHLIYCCTSRKVPLGKLPADVGCVVQNLATCLATFEAVTMGKPLYERVMTVSGKGVTNPKNLLVKNGTDYQSIIDFCGGQSQNVCKIVEGGPMTGAAILSLNMWTKKATSGLLLLESKEISSADPTPCISCGRCANACPMRLMPMEIDFYANAKDYDKAVSLGGAMACIECGCCAYVCPAKRPLLQAIRLTKAKQRK